jgi:hypothetical protein
MQLCISCRGGGADHLSALVDRIGSARAAADAEVVADEAAFVGLRPPQRPRSR